METASLLLQLLGGASNIRDIEPCMLRIRIEVESPKLVDEESLRVSEVLALVRSGNIVQLVTGVNARSIALQMLQLCLPQDVSAGTGKSLFSRIPQPIK